jgi:hypothetical protein
MVPAITLSQAHGQMSPLAMRDVPPPTTPFGYPPPPEAIALGWICGSGECQRQGDGAVVARWPRSCPACGHRVATRELAEPWQHAARRVEIDARLLRPRGAGDLAVATADDLLWHVVDALRASRPDLAERHRLRLGSYLNSRAADDRGFDGAGHRWSVVQEALAYHRLDLAAREFTDWHRTTTGRRRLAHQVLAFLEHPGPGAAHPAAPVHSMLTWLLPRLDEVVGAELRHCLDRFSGIGVDGDPVALGPPGRGS